LPLPLEVLLKEYISISISLFAIMDPLAAIPTLISYVGGSTGLGGRDLDTLVKQAVNRASAAIAILLTVFSLAGEFVLLAFNISIESLKVAGGLLLIVLAIKMLTAKEKEEVEKGDFAVVPIATPLIVGPGTMSTLIVYSRVYGPLTTLLGAYIALGLTYITLRYSYVMFRYFGTSVLQGLGKFMSIIVASIAVELAISGLRDLGVLAPVLAP